MFKKTVLAVLLCGVAVVAMAQEKAKPVYKVSRISLTEVIVSCNNGTNPTGAKLGDTLVISCGR